MAVKAHDLLLEERILRAVSCKPNQVTFAILPVVQCYLTVQPPAKQK